MNLRPCFLVGCAGAALLLAPCALPGELKFQHHFIDRALPGTSYGQTCLVDVDKDGDLDFITGGNADGKTVFWFEFQAPDKWVRHVLGTNHPSDVGGTAIDVDGDGWVDHVTGGVWYRNCGKPRTEAFERIVFDKDLNAVHDLVAADLDGDGRLDVITLSDRNNLRWYRIPKRPREPWERHDIGPGVHAGVAVGDIDGDGDLDIARSNAWFENADGQGTKWIEHPIPFGNPRQPFPFATRCVILDNALGGHEAVVADVDGDGDLDICSKLWRPRADNANEGRNHADFVENLLRKK